MTLQDFLYKRVLILTADGRTLIGELASYDQVTNLIISNTVERIIRPVDDPTPSQSVEHGLYVVRGDNVLAVGLVDEERDKSIDWDKVRGSVIGGIKNV